MKAMYEALALPESQPFLIREYDQIAFEAPFHFHPEFELTLITSGHGQRYVGSQMERFASGDLILIGSNSPHCWKLDSGEQPGSCVVIQFTRDFMGENFFLHPVMTSIDRLLHVSRNGIRLNGRSQQATADSIRELVKLTDPFEMCIRLLMILQLIAVSGEWEVLSTSKKIGSITTNDQDRIVRVMNYIQLHFREDLKLKDVADEINMTPQAFCRFIKRSTRRTLMEIVTGYRLDCVMSLLTATDRPIAEIAYESGFGDLSYFHKVFKKHQGTTPAAYRKKFVF